MMKGKYYFASASLMLILCFDIFSAEPKVCFFTKDNYQGNSLCTTQGNAVEQLPPDWNDKISSIEVPHGMVVTVFKDIDFSGSLITFKESIDSLSSPKWASINNSISSFKVRSAACFYELDNFHGESICLSGNESIDLYHSSDPVNRLYHILNPLNDRISAIKIPSNTQVTIYKDNGFNGDHFVLKNDYNYSELEKIGMNDDITSIQVSQQEHFICDQYCVVKDMLSIPLGHAFGKYWLDDRIKYKEVLVSFKLSDEDNYSIELIDGGVINVQDRLVLLIHKNHEENSFIFDLSKRSDTLSFLFRFSGSYAELQFIESLGREAVYISPLVGSLFDFGFTKASLIVNNFNENNPLIINRVVLTAEKVSTRIERSFVGTATCWLVPILNVYNYVIQGKCNQVDRFVKNINNFFRGYDNKILQVSGSATPLPKINTNDPIEFEALFAPFTSKVEGQLTKITADMKGGSLTVLATALACKVSMNEQILPNIRHRRDLTPPCVVWTLNILTDFTLLFGDSLATWNADNFGRVMERILRMGDTGYAVSNSESERRLIENVQHHLAENMDSMLHIKTAFDFSQLGYADYMLHQAPEQIVYPPIVAQELPLGRYELSLPNFQFVETVPRIRRGGEWVEDPLLHFEIEVISGTTADTEVARQTVLPTITQWRKAYYQAKKQSLKPKVSSTNAEKPSSADDTVIEAACLVSDVTQSWLRTSRDDYIYVVVRLSGQIVSITMAVDINESDAGIAGSLTNPEYVLHIETEGAVRGAGTAAIRALADHLSKKGKRTLVSEVISKPSAIVKKKIGFKFSKDL
ncbi:peptidase inhibitor family I36 protein [Yersinia kristensenii]|uniref:peptidase inhibitor family I36 protein n=1 Tax=Yersinia kristensenii TaxID=28152 RepID=UPI003896CB49